MLLVCSEVIETRLEVDGRELLEPLVDVPVVLVVFKAPLKNIPKATIMITAIPSRVTIPSEIALLAFANVRQPTKMSSVLFESMRLSCCSDMVNCLNNL